MYLAEFHSGTTGGAVHEVVRTFSRGLASVACCIYAGIGAIWAWLGGLTNVPLLRLCRPPEQTCRTMPDQHRVRPGSPLRYATGVTSGQSGCRLARCMTSGIGRCPRPALLRITDCLSSRGDHVPRLAFMVVSASAREQHRRGDRGTDECQHTFGGRQW